LPSKLFNKEVDFETDTIKLMLLSASSTPNIDTHVYIEDVEGDEVSVESISWEGTHYVLTITDKVTTGEPYFVELEHHQPSALPEEIQERIKTETIKTLDALGVKYGASHAEFKITKKGDVYAIETGARMGGDFIGSDLVYFSTDYDFLKAVIDVAFGVFQTPETTNTKCSGVYFLSEETKRLLPVLKNSTNFEYIRRSEIQDENLKLIRCSADRSGYLIYQSDKKILL
jgi:biotin carboxylase